MSADLIRQKARERHFLEQLLDGRKLENYKIPVPIKAELRKYQQVCDSALPPHATDKWCPVCVCTFTQLPERLVPELVLHLNSPERQYIKATG